MTTFRSSGADVSVSVFQMAHAMAANPGRMWDWDTQLPRDYFQFLWLEEWAGQREEGGPYLDEFMEDFSHQSDWWPITSD